MIHVFPHCILQISNISIVSTHFSLYQNSFFFVRLTIKSFYMELFVYLSYEVATLCFIFLLSKLYINKIAVVVCHLLRDLAALETPFWWIWYFISINIQFQRHWSFIKSFLISNKNWKIKIKIKKNSSEFSLFFQQFEPICIHFLFSKCSRLCRSLGRS